MLCAFIVSACTTGGRNFAPVEQAANKNSKSSSQALQATKKSGQRPALYKVRSGDTLYSIAWRYGLDYRELARWNVIDPPYVIFPVSRWCSTARPRHQSRFLECLPRNLDSPPSQAYLVQLEATLR